MVSRGAEIRREELVEALEQTGGNRLQAGRLLGISRATIYRWMERWEVDADFLRVIAGRWEVLDLLGRGSQGTVLRVKDGKGELGRKALKLLRAGPEEDGGFAALAEEYRVLSLLRHPSLVGVHDFGIDPAAGGRPFLVMDLVDGQSFAEACRGRPLHFVATALVHALEGVDQLHRHGLLHRDLKSANILVEADSGGVTPKAVTVMDLTLARRYSGATPAPAGSVGHIAPEVLLGRPPSRASDLFALGVVLYQALTGDLPSHEVLGRGDTLLPTLGRIRPDIPEEFARLLARLLAGEPSERFAEAGEVIDALAPWTGSETLLLAPCEASLVGRSEELARALATLQPVPAEGEEDTPPLLLLEGEGGIGKSRFIEACMAELRARGVAVASTACRKSTRSALGPISEAVDLLFASASAGDTIAAEILQRHRTCLEGLEPRPSVLGARDTGPRPTVSRFHLVDGLISLLCELATARPLVLVLDDLHQADPLLLDFLWHLARRARRLPLRLLAAARPLDDDALPWKKGLTVEHLVDDMHLAPLDADGVRELAAQRLGPARASYIARQLWSASGGHPLFVHQLLEELAERTIEREGVEPSGLPRTLEEAIRARLERLDSADRELLSSLAAAGREVDEDELEAVTGNLSRARVLDLTQRGLLRHTPAGRLDLAHAFLREVLLEGLDATQRRGWHQRWAEHLRRRDDDAVLLAEQSLAAAEGAGAREDLLAAAEQLFARWQYAGAARFFQAAVDRMAPEDPARLEVYPRLARAWREAHDAPALERVCRDWVETAELLGDLAARSTALSKLASALRERGQGAQAQRLAREAIELAEQADDPRAAALANKVLASILWAGWEHSSALAPFERALHLAEQTGDQRELAYSLQDVALPYAITGRSAAAIEASRKAQKLFQQLGDRVWELLARTNETLVYTRLGDLQAARQLSESMIEELSDVPGIPVELAMENLVFLLNRMGLYERTLELGQRLIEHAAIVGRHGPRIAALLAMGEALTRLGDTRSAREHHRLARDLAEALGEERQLLFAELAIAADLRRSRRIDQARRRAEQVREQALPTDARRQLILASIELARLARLAGEPSRGMALLDDADNQLFQSGEDGPALRAQLLFERARGWKELGQEGLLLACAEEGAGLASRHGPVEIEVRLLALAAEVYESQGQSQRAAQHLTRAAQTLRELAGEIHDESRRARFLSDPERSAILLRADRLEPIGSGADSTSTLARLYEVCEEITRGGQLEDLLERVVALAVESCGAERGLLLLRDEGTKELTLAAGCDLDGGRGEGLEFSQSVQTRVEQEGAVLIADVRSDPDLGRVPSVSALGIRSLMGVALRMEGRDLGTLYVDSRANRTLFSSQDLRLLQALADQAAVALAYGRLVGKVAQQRDAHYKAAARTYRFGNLVSLSKSMRRVFELLEKVADTDVPVIVLGESGTGKEVISRAMHFASRRREKVFLSENCAAIPETLLESILFGHVRGAFTGADRDRPGLFELANGGTLLLDEVGEMSPGLQAKLLRVLQEKEFRPLGSDRVVATDVRIIAATHQDLGARVAEGSFRQDLYFRLNGVTIQLPPLRNRREDIPLLVRHFLEREAAAARRPVPRMTAAVMRLLCSHDWPGNIRELENTVRRLLLVSEDDLIGTDALATDPHFALSPSAATSRDIGSGGFKASPADPEEKQRLEEALEQAGGNRGRAAALLGISRATLYRRLRRFGIGRN